MYKIEKDAAIVIMAKACKEGDWSYETFVATYGHDNKKKEYIQFLLGQIGMIKRSEDSFWQNGTYFAIYEWM